MTNKFQETAKSASLIAPAADIDTAAVASTVYHSVAGYRRAVVHGHAAAPGAEKTLTVQMKQATDDEGAGAKDLGNPVVVAAEGTEALLAVAEAWVEQMDHANGFTFVGATVKTNKGSAVRGGASLILDCGRYSE